MIVLATNNQADSRVSVGRSALSVLFLVVFLDNLGFAIVVPYLYFYMLELIASAEEKSYSSLWQCPASATSYLEQHRLSGFFL